MLVRQSNRSQTDHSAPGGANPIIQFVIRVAIAIPESFNAADARAARVSLWCETLCNNRPDFCVPHMASTMSTFGQVS